MKPRFITAILLFISAYSPLFLILAVKDIDFSGTHYQLKNPLAIYILLGTTFLSVVLFFFTLKKIPKGIPVKIVSLNNRSVDLINYTIPYMVSFIGVDLSKPDDVISLTIFLLILLLLTISSKSVFINPLLAFAGYGIYDLQYVIEGESNIVSKIIICKHDLNVGDTIYINILTRFLYFETKKQNENNAVH